MSGKLPKEYLSNSQIECALNYPAQYVNRYIYKIQDEVSPQQAFGKVVTDILEGRVKCPKEFLKPLEKVKRFERNDVGLEAIFTRGKDNVKVIGYLDGESGTGKNIVQGEFKTGVHPWTLDRVQKHEQLKLYAALHYTKTKFIPPQELIWIPTKKTGDIVEICGEPVSFKVQHTMTDVLYAVKRVWKAYDVIVKLVEQYNDDTL